MASRALVTSDLLAESGKSSPEVSEAIERAVGEVTLDLLTENDGRFRRLAKSTTLTLSKDDSEIVLPTDYNTVKGRMTKIDSDGDYVARLEVVDEEEFYHRKGDSQYGGTLYAFIETRTAGDYLVLNADMTETTYIKFFYYRIATVDDTDLIKKVSIVKTGVRGRLPHYFPDSATQEGIYMRMKMGFRENPTTHSTGSILRPSKKQQSMNRLMHKIGRGQ